jgi:hypothetical protein
VRTLAALFASVALTACAGGGGEADTQAPEVIEVTSTAFAADHPIPAIYTCAGSNVSPPLSWTGVPEGARELALVVDDPDAPRGTYTHWILFGLPPSTESLAEGSLPANATQARNSNGQAGYTTTDSRSTPSRIRWTSQTAPTPTRALTTISRAAIAQGRLVGTFAAG